MEQNTNNKTVKTNNKKSIFSIIRFDKNFIKQVERIVDKANKKQFGKKVKPKNILINLFCLASDSLLESAIQKAQQETLSIKDKKDMFKKENISKFKGTQEQFEEKMMELMNNFLTKSST